MESKKSMSIAGVGRISGESGPYKNINISGVGRVEGDIQAEKISIAGTGKFTGKVQVDNINISGASKLKGSIKCENFSIAGYANCRENIECEQFRCSGTFKINGLLNAENISVNMSGKCSVNEIGCKSIEVKVEENRRSVKFFNKSQLVVETIEGDEIYLENTKCKSVRGNVVVLGEGCEIGCIEYISSYKISSSSKVENTIQISKSNGDFMLN